MGLVAEGLRGQIFGPGTRALRLRDTLVSLPPHPSFGRGTMDFGRRTPVFSVKTPQPFGWETPCFRLKDTRITKDNTPYWWHENP